MQTGNLVDLMKNLLDETGVPAHCIDLELTESLLMNNVNETQHLLKRLKEMGVQLSIDDFGTGYSSLSYLKQFSVDKLKIDKSFIDHVTSDPNDAVIVQATIAMAHSIGLTVIAEGVETQAQASYLRTLHCDQIQGYYFSRPLPVAEVSKLLLSSARLDLPVSEQKPTVLLVDDEPNILSALRRVLRRDGYEILTAQSGEEALEILAHQTVMVILSDQRMPNMTGTEFLSRVKILHPRTVRIILSGYADLNSITEAINKGEIYKFRTKPWDDDELRSDVREAFIHYEALERRKNRPIAIKP
jgi:CheY-like chemotaxis protein